MYLGWEHRAEPEISAHILGWTKIINNLMQHAKDPQRKNVKKKKKKGRILECLFHFSSEYKEMFSTLASVVQWLSVDL